MNLSDTHLLYEAQELYKETGKTPQQIAEINKELFNALDDFIILSYSTEPFNIKVNRMNEAIFKAQKVLSKSRIS